MSNRKGRLRLLSQSIPGANPNVSHECKCRRDGRGDPLLRERVRNLGYSVQVLRTGRSARTRKFFHGYW